MISRVIMLLHNNSTHKKLTVTYMDTLLPVSMLIFTLPTEIVPIKAESVTPFSSNIQLFFIAGRISVLTESVE